MTPDGDPAEQIAALSAALGRDIPAGFGQLVVYRGEAVSDAQESVQSAQQLLAAAKRALWLIAILVVVLTAAAILIAPRRWRAVLVLSVGTAAALVVLRGATRQAVDEAQDLAPRPGGKAAIEAILGGASQSLLRVFGIVLLIALVATVVALFALRWRRQDLVLVGAVALGAAVVALAGVSIWSLLIGVAVGIAAGIVANRLVVELAAALGGGPAPRRADRRRRHRLSRLNPSVGASRSRRVRLGLAPRRRRPAADRRCRRGGARRASRTRPR